MRVNATNRGYDSRWRKMRKMYLAAHPLCAQCWQDGFVVAASVVDHIDPHKGDMHKFNDQRNWQSLCKRCHDRKTASEDGGFGNREGKPISGCGADGMPIDKRHPWNAMR